MMIYTINKLPLFAQVYIYIVAPIFLIIIIILIAKFGLSLKKDQSGFSLSFGKLFKKQETPTDHSKCPNKHDAAELMQKIRMIERRIMDLKYIEGIKRQMNIAEGTVKEKINKMLRIYTALLKKKGFEDPIKTDSCQSYLLLLKIVENRLTDKFRLLIRENHFAEKTESEFDEYVKSKLNELRYFVTETLNQLYFYSKDITITELFDANEDKINESERLIRDCFHGCRITAISVKEQINALEIAANEIFNKFVN